MKARETGRGHRRANGMATAMRTTPDQAAPMDHQLLEPGFAVRTRTPRAVLAARTILWIQAVLGIAATAFLTYVYLDLEAGGTTFEHEPSNGPSFPAGLDVFIELAYLVPTTIMALSLTILVGPGRIVVQAFALVQQGVFAVVSLLYLLLAGLTLVAEPSPQIASKFTAGLLLGLGLPLAASILLLRRSSVDYFRSPPAHGRRR